MKLLLSAIAMILLSLRALIALPSHNDLPLAQANDNRASAGVLRDGVLTVHLVVGMARWYPQAQDGPYVDVPAIAEEGKAPQIPAPLIRVPTGTIIDATIRNTLT